jgi:hypothetical protein
MATGSPVSLAQRMLEPVPRRADECQPDSVRGRSAGRSAKEDTVTLGPLEYVVVGFNGSHFDGSIASEVKKVVEKGTIRLVDVVAIAKNAPGEVEIIEIDAKSDPAFATFEPLLRDRIALFTPEDVVTIADGLAPDTAAFALLFEHRWAEDIKDAIEDKGGFVIDRAVIPPEVLAEVSAEIGERAQA